MLMNYLFNVPPQGPRGNEEDIAIGFVLILIMFLFVCIACYVPGIIMEHL